jgi:hypothetical protein
MRKLVLLGALCATLAAATPPAGDVLWFYGHNGFDGEGHADIQALLQSGGAVVDIDGGAVLPTLDNYTLIFIVMPGFYNPTDFFSANEKTRLSNWLAVGSHRVVMVGEWEGFYNGQAVMEDLLAAIGNPIVYDPGAWDSGCAHCSGPLGVADPLTAGLDHVCYAYTATWDPAVGAPLAYPENPGAPGPYIVSNGTDIPCIVGIGDGNVVNDLCGHLDAFTGDADSRTFVSRLYTVSCAGEVLWGCCLPDGSCQMSSSSDCAAAGGTWYENQPCGGLDCGGTGTEQKSWGRVKALFR